MSNDKGEEDENRKCDPSNKNQKNSNGYVQVFDDKEREIEFGTLAEQEDETYYDHRENACDDIEKGRIQFPRKLYGREKELDQLNAMMQDPLLQVVLLAGCSGTGKSALVEEFVRNRGDGVHFIAGKFGELKAGDPFLALSQALNQFVRRLSQKSTEQELAVLRKRLLKADIGPGSHNALVLTDTLIPDLSHLLEEQSKQNKDSSPQELVIAKAATHDLNVVKYSFQNFIKALATTEHPVLLFMDDMQWAEDASLQLFMDLCRQKAARHVILIGAYRPNEIQDDHPFSLVMKDILEKAQQPEQASLAKIHSMEIFNLSPDHVAQFIADSMDQSPEEIMPISQAVYTKTLGNIFFVQQALEQLVRQNIVYYDVMCFEWRFARDLTRAQLEHLLPDDVLATVLNKFNTLPQALQTALALAAYTHDTIHIPLLVNLINSRVQRQDTNDDSAGILHSSGLKKLMNLAYVEGLVLHCYTSGETIKQQESQMSSVSDEDDTKATEMTTGGCLLRSEYLYKFAHDRIREAACASIPQGDQRHKVLLGISQVLLERGSPGTNDWMLFTAARHLNSLPKHWIPDTLDLVELNLRLGKIAVSKGAFSEAAVVFRAAAERLKAPACWRQQEHYEQTLELKNYLAEAEQFLGNHDKVMETCEEIFQNAKSTPDKCRAHYCYIMATNSKQNSNHSQTADTALDILQMYGMPFPNAPTKRQVEVEKVWLQLALRGRSLFCLTEFPITTDPAIAAPIKIAHVALLYSMMSGRALLANMICYRLLRFAVKRRIITDNLIFILTNLGESERRTERYDRATMLANVGIGVMDRFPGNRELGFLKGKMTVYNLVALRLPARELIDPLLESYKALFASGETLFSIGCAMMAGLAYFIASMRLTSLIEAKLTVYEERAYSVGSKGFGVILSLLRQAIYNLQGGAKASPNPVVLDGAACSAEKIQADLHGDARRMNLREIGTFRLMLAVIFDDEPVMEEMLDVLDPFPVFDIPTTRQLVRMTYVGFGALILSQKSGKHKKWANTALHFFKKLVKFGSANAQPVYSCMKALAKPTVARFDEAIQVCGNEGLLNLAALMNERCGLMLVKMSKERVGDNSSKDRGEEYLRCAIWLYSDWGAKGKVEQLQSRHECLHSAMTEKAPMQLNALRQQATLFTSPSSRCTEQLSEMRSTVSGS